MGVRYRVEVRHLSQLQRRMYPQMTDRPFVVVDGENGQVVARFATRSGALSWAGRKN
jgi:hypothetical protein